MATHRDTVRANRQERFRAARKAGISLDAERRRSGANPKLLAYEAGKLLNDNVPRTDDEQLVVDNPPAGVFDGANVTFTLSQPVAGTQIEGVWGDNATPQTIKLTRSTSNPPPARSFFIDLNAPTTVVVGDPPGASDALIFTYKRKAT